MPQGGLEIPITLTVSQGVASKEVFDKMKRYVEQYYYEPGNIKFIENDSNDDDIF